MSIPTSLPKDPVRRAKSVFGVFSVSKFLRKGAYGGTLKEYQGRKEYREKRAPEKRQKVSEQKKGKVRKRGKEHWCNETRWKGK